MYIRRAFAEARPTSAPMATRALSLFAVSSLSYCDGGSSHEREIYGLHHVAATIATQASQRSSRHRVPRVYHTIHRSTATSPISPLLRSRFPIPRLPAAPTVPAGRATPPKTLQLPPAVVPDRDHHTRPSPDIRPQHLLRLGHLCPPRRRRPALRAVRSHLVWPCVPHHGPHVELGRAAARCPLGPVRAGARAFLSRLHDDGWLGRDVSSAAGALHGRAAVQHPPRRKQQRPLPPSLSLFLSLFPIIPAGFREEPAVTIGKVKEIPRVLSYLIIPSGKKILTSLLNCCSGTSPHAGQRTRRCGSGIASRASS